MRAYLAGKIPVLFEVEAITPASITDATSRGPLHLFCVGIDATWGVWGSRLIYTTISARTGRALLSAQNYKVFKAVLPWSEAPEWYAVAPLWALALGAFLETINPGHLQAAMLADVTRNILAINNLTTRLGAQILAVATKGVGDANSH